METMMNAIELTGAVNERRQLQLDDLLPFAGPKRVRVIVFYPQAEAWDETEWLHAAAHNPAFAYLKDAAEDIYSVSDGKPIHDERDDWVGVYEVWQERRTAWN